MIMRELGDMEGFRICGTVVNNLRYADDTVIVAESEEQLQHLINVVVAKVHLNSAKSFSIVFYKSIITPYMVYEHPRKYLRINTVVHLFRKSVFLRYKM